MTTPSQAAFEKLFKETRPAVGRGWFTKDANGYTNLGIEMSFKLYEATCKQVLEDAIAICKKEWLTESSDYPYDRGWSNAAKRIVKNLQGLLMCTMQLKD